MALFSVLHRLLVNKKLGNTANTGAPTHLSITRPFKAVRGLRKNKIPKTIEI